MVKWFFLFFLVCHCTTKLFSQTPAATNVKPDAAVKFSYKESNFATEVTLIDPNGRPFNRTYADVSGSPFIVDGFNEGTLLLGNDKKFSAVKVRIDIEKQELHYLSSTLEMVANAGSIKEVQFVDSVNARPYKFKTGFPKIDNQDENNFYEVLSDGTISLLKSYRKKLVVNKNDLSGEVEKRFDLYEDYYVFFKNEMKRIKKDKEFILQLLTDKKEKVEAFVKDNHLNFKNIDDLKKLFNYYNSLRAA